MEGLEIHGVSLSPLRTGAELSPSRVASSNDDVSHAPAGKTENAHSGEKLGVTEKLKAVLSEVLDNLPENARLSIRIDRDANRYVYEFRDPKSGEVKGQFPSEAVLKALRASRQAVSGHVLDQSA